MAWKSGEPYPFALFGLVRLLLYHTQNTKRTDSAVLCCPIGDDPGLGWLVMRWPRASTIIGAVRHIRFTFKAWFTFDVLR